MIKTLLCSVIFQSLPIIYAVYICTKEQSYSITSLIIFMRLYLTCLSKANNIDCSLSIVRWPPVRVSSFRFWLFTKSKTPESIGKFAIYCKVNFFIISLENLMSRENYDFVHHAIPRKKVMKCIL